MVLHKDYGKPQDYQNDIALIQLDKVVGKKEGDFELLFLHGKNGQLGNATNSFHVKVHKNAFVGPVCLPWDDKGEDYLKYDDFFQHTVDHTEGLIMMMSSAVTILWKLPDGAQRLETDDCEQNFRHHLSISSQLSSLSSFHYQFCCCQHHHRHLHYEKIRKPMVMIFQ